MRRLFDEGCLTRDGVRLSADVYLPDDPRSAPAVLVRTPYDNTRADFVTWARRGAGAGYAVVIQDVRGRGDSDGQFTPWSDEFDDGYDAVEWVAAQPWCNGRVGMVGGSYMGWVQWTTASRRPPHLVTLVTSGSPGRWFRDWPYRFGAFWAEDYVEWVNRVSARSNQPSELVDWMAIHEHRQPRQMDAVLGRHMPHWQECLDHDTFDAYWQGLMIDNHDEIALPVLHITGWFDACAPGEFHHYHAMVRSSPVPEQQSLLVGGWDHGGACTTGKAVAGALALGPDASLDMHGVWLAWFDRWLKGTSTETFPAVRYFVMGANSWRDATAWPPAETAPRSFYLSGDGALVTAATGQAAQSFRYDPADPTPALEPLTGNPLPEWSPRDVGFLAKRHDVLTYTSAPLAQTLEVAGPVHLLLDVASSAVDTDFAAVLADVGPDGQAILVSHGILRASFRDSLSEPSPLTPGERYRLEIELSDLGHAFLPDHRLQLIVCSCLFPYYHPNPNTGALYGDEGERAWLVATQTVFSGGTAGSRLSLHTRTA